MSAYNRVPLYSSWTGLNSLFFAVTTKQYYQPAQVESDHKDILISQLKADLFELSQREKDYDNALDDYRRLEQRFRLLQDDMVPKSPTPAHLTPMTQHPAEFSDCCDSLFEFPLSFFPF